MLPQSPGQAAWHSLRNRKAPWNSGPCSVLASQQTWGDQQVQWQKLHHGGFSHPLCLLNSVPFDPCSSGHSSASFPKTTPPKGIFTSWTQMIPEPNNMAGCPLCPPQHCRGKCGKGWWYPVLTLYLWVAVLNSLFLGNTKHRVSSLGVWILSYPWVGFDPFAYYVAWDVFSCRKTELCLPNLSPITISP